MVSTIVLKRNRFFRFLDDKTSVPHNEIRYTTKFSPINREYSSGIATQFNCAIRFEIALFNVNGSEYATPESAGSPNANRVILTPLGRRTSATYPAVASPSISVESASSTSSNPSRSTRPFSSSIRIFTEEAFLSAENFPPSAW